MLDGGWWMVDDRQPVHDKCASLSNKPGRRNICKCSELCADLFTEDSPSGKLREDGLSWREEHHDHRRYN